MPDNRKREKHPAFGMVGFHRVTNGPGRNPLFGSHLDRHHETIPLRVHEAVRGHDLSRDWIYADNQILEVELSPVQFSQMLTTMNVGEGVPCTIRWQQGVGRVAEMPDDYESEQTKIYEAFKAEIAEKEASIGPRLAELDEILSKKSINKGDRERIRELALGIFRYYSENTSFVLKQFEESAEKVVTAAKAQVDEFVTSTLIRAGMEKLKERFGTPGVFTGRDDRSDTVAERTTFGHGEPVMIGPNAGRRDRGDK